MRAAIERWLQRRWWTAAGQRPPLPLLALERLYAWLRRRHQAAYASQQRAVVDAPRPVLVVGNLIVGGAGKTPTVIAIVQALRAAGRTPGVISRGHGRQGDAVQLVRNDSAAQTVGDEPLLIHRRTGAPLVVGRDRVVAAHRLCELHPEVDVIVADDGLQHRALGRQAQLIVFDERGIGNGHLLPAGPLREPLPPRLPPRTRVLYNAPAPTTPLPGACLQRQIAGIAEWPAWQAGAAPSIEALHALRGRPVLAVAGIASPERFFTMLEAAGLQVRRLPLPDHAPLDPLPWPAGEPDVLITEKDAVKLAGRPLGATRVWVARLDFQLPDGLLEPLLHWLQPARPNPSA